MNPVSINDLMVSMTSGLFAIVCCSGDDRDSSEMQTDPENEELREFFSLRLNCWYSSGLGLAFWTIGNWPGSLEVRAFLTFLFSLSSFALLLVRLSPPILSSLSVWSFSFEFCLLFVLFTGLFPKIFNFEPGSDSRSWIEVLKRIMIKY